MANHVMMKGKHFSLAGSLPTEGETAPDCELMNETLERTQLSSFKGKTILLMTVPSLDTPVCSKQAHRFNQELGRFGRQITPLLVSMDLPFAQKRWCGAEEGEFVITLSDYLKRELGEKYGVLIPDLGLLARALFIIDSSFTLRHSYLVQEVTDEPDYEHILAELSAHVL